MSTWVEYDPTTGVKEYNRIDEEKQAFVVHKEQDVSGVLDRAADLRATGATDRWRKHGLEHYATIPLVTQYELLSKYGLNIQNRNHLPAVLDVINRDYPYLKSTNKTHSLRHKRSGSSASSPKPGPLPSIILPT